MLNVLEQQATVIVKNGNTTLEMDSAEFMTQVGSGQIVIDCITKVDDKFVVETKGENFIIKSASLVDRLSSVFAQKDKGLSHIQVTLGCIKENGVVIPNNFVGFVRVPENLGIRKGVFNIEDVCKLRLGKNTKTIKGEDKYPATLQIMSLSYGGDEEQAKLCLRHGLFMTKSLLGDYSIYLQQGELLYNLENDSDVLTSSEGLLHYMPFGASPSNDRQKSIYLIDVTNGYKRAHEILSELTYGAYDKKQLSKYVTYGELAKASSRWFQWMAPSSELGVVERVAIFDGKFNKNKGDGMFYSSSEDMADRLYQKFNFTILPRALDGVFFQCRPAQTKAGSVNVPEKVLWTIIHQLDPNPIILGWDEITEEFNEDMASGKYKGRIVILGDGPLSFLWDRNTLKSDYDYRIKPEYTVLRFLKSNQSNFSASIFQKMLAKNEGKTVAFVKGLFSNTILSKLEKTFLAPKAKVVTPDSFKSGFYMDDVISSMFPGYLISDRNLSLNALDNITKATNKMLEKSKASMSGRNAGLTVGLEFIWDLSFLNNHEVFCPAASKMFADEKMAEVINHEGKIFMIKYPSMDLNEYMVATTVTLKEIKSRIKAAPISKELQDMFISYYASLHDSVIVVPACELFKNMLAGSDFDTDQLCWSADELMIEVLENEQPIAVVIED